MEYLNIKFEKMSCRFLLIIIFILNTNIIHASDTLSFSKNESVFFMHIESSVSSNCILLYYAFNKNFYFELYDLGLKKTLFTFKRKIFIKYYFYLDDSVFIYQKSNFNRPVKINLSNYELNKLKKKDGKVNFMGEELKKYCKSCYYNSRYNDNQLKYYNSEIIFENEKTETNEYIFFINALEGKLYYTKKK